MGFESRFGGFAGWKICTGGYGWIPDLRRDLLGRGRCADFRRSLTRWKPLGAVRQAGAGLAMRNLTPIPSTIAPPTAATPMQKTPTSGKPPAARTNPPADAPRTMPS